MSLAWTSRFVPIYEIGVGDVHGASGTARWDVARWDAPLARWAGTEPSWFDVSCDVQQVNIWAGRPRSTDRFEVARAEVVVDNSTGWADPMPPPAIPDDATPALSIRPGRQVRIGVEHIGLGVCWLFRGYIDEVEPLYHPVDVDTLMFRCIDALGEVGRAKFTPFAVPTGAGEPASARVHRILDRAAWPADRRDVETSGTTLIASDLGGQAVDLLGQASESVGGAVFGDLSGRIAFRNRDWQTYLPDTPPDGSIGNIDPGTPGYWSDPIPAVPGYLTPSVGTVSTPDTPDLTPVGPFRLTARLRTDTLPASGFPVWVSKDGVGGREYLLYISVAGNGVQGSVSDAATPSTLRTIAVQVPVALGSDHTVGFEATPGSAAAVGIVDDVRTPRAFQAPIRPPDTTNPLRVGTVMDGFTGRIYWAQMETLDATGNPTGLVWRFDASEYPGGGATSYVDPRGRTWTLTSASAITPTVPEVPPEWVPASGDVCPIGFGRPYRRADISTRVLLARVGDEMPQQFDSVEGQRLFGIEPYERLNLWTERDATITALGDRLLTDRGYENAPRAITAYLDATTADNVIDLGASVSIFRPSRYRCRLEEHRGIVFDDVYFATGVRHELTAERWVFEIDMDLATAYAAAGGRWDRGRWDRATWADAP